VTVVRLEAWCDHVTEDEYRDELAHSSLPAHTVKEALMHFRHGSHLRVQEFAVLADGRRLPLGDELGFGGGGYVSAGRSEPVDPWLLETLERLEADVRTTVLPDDDETEDEHPWEWLAERLRAHGVTAEAEQLKRVPYEIVFSQRLLARVLANTLQRLRIDKT
jgi:hypothetical protein